jgi:hypothetical protein
MTEQTRWKGRIYLTDRRLRSGAVLPKDRILVEFDWRDIKPDQDIWLSIREKYLEEKKKGFVMGGYVPFTKKIKPEEALQILRLTKAVKARVNINRVGQIIIWKLL